MWGSFRLGQAVPYLKSFGEGQQAGYEIYQILNSKSNIQQQQQQLNNSEQYNFQIEGNISIKNAGFSYKTKKNIKVLDKLSMEIKQGQSIALVGESGCGKSTIISLLQRFYDVDEGEILIDGKNIKDIDLNWYRQNVGLISQQPVLFATSIRDNIKIGKQDATDEEIFTALKKANAYDFVMNLEQQLDTFVGNQGVSQLSGGQKQRISIARAILKNPKILLLDEATSALDRKNEQAIQQTIQDAFKGKTVITIAHRLKTIENCDVVYAIENGKVVQQGKYQDLVQQEGYLNKLIQKQIIKSDDNNQLDSNDDLQPISQNSYDEIQNFQTQDFQNLQTDHQLYSKKYRFLKKNKDTEELENKQPRVNIIQTIKNLDEKIKQQKQKELKTFAIRKRTFSYNKESTCIAILACLFSLIAGCCISVMTVFLIRMIEVLIKVDVMDEDDFRYESNLNCLMIVVVSISIFISNSSQQILWNKVGLNLTDKLRKICFEKILNMKVSWFDQKQNNVYKLQKIITHDTLSANSLISTQINVYLQVFSAVASGLIIAFFHDWRTSLVGLIAIPAIFISSSIQNAQVKGFSEKASLMHKESGSCMQETIFHIKTIYSYTRQAFFEKIYQEKLWNVYKLVPSQSWKMGLSFGFSQMITNFVYAILFYCGAIFYRDYDVTAKDMLTSIFVLMYSSFGAGTQLQFMTGVGDSVASAKNIFEILDSQDEIQEQNQQMLNVKLIKSGEFKGKIEFKNVSFKYPTREEQVLCNISFLIKPNQKIAFVGESGCGKSTIIQLLAKLYQINNGKILIDDIDIDNYELQYLRSKFGIVNQEPDLFSGSIYSNVKYNSGIEDQEKIDVICKKSLIDTFTLENIQDKNQKIKNNIYLSDIGERGNMLSGGQKQRVAIARALIRNPEILLLDEATSALDIKNEKIIQSNIDQQMKNKTQITIAHRIQTIINSDIIFVVLKGQIVERGSYEQLIELKNYFYKLQNGNRQK